MDPNSIAHVIRRVDKGAIGINGQAVYARTVPVSDATNDGLERANVIYSNRLSGTAGAIWRTKDRVWR